MRRKEKEITDKKIIDSILHDALVCRIALSHNNVPYIVPMNFGYKDNILYLHSANTGKKIDILKENNIICFEVDINEKLVSADRACNWGMCYKSVVGQGTASFIIDKSEKIIALNTIMEKYSGSTMHTFPESGIAGLTVIKVKITSISGKQSGH